MLGMKIFVSLLVMTALKIPLLLNCKKKITSLLGIAKNGVVVFFFFKKVGSESSCSASEED